MRIVKKLHTDEETILHFLDVFGGGAVALGSAKKHARPGFFLFSGAFIHEYIEDNFFKKVELLLNALEAAGFAPGEGALGAMRKDEAQSRETANLLLRASKAWQSGDDEARVDVSWAASEYTSTLRQFLHRLKNLIYPLLEQNISTDEEQKIAEGLNNLAFEAPTEGEADKYTRMIETLEEELSDWG